MKPLRIVSALTAASLAFGSAAFAQSTLDQSMQQSYNARRAQQGLPPTDKPETRAEQRANAERDRADARAQPRADARGQYRADQRGSYRGEARDYRGDGRTSGYRDGNRGDFRDHAWRRGDRLPSEYRTRQYVVDDWRGHRLSAPPRGYQWVQAGGDYVLVAIATGIIASILLNQ